MDPTPQPPAGRNGNGTKVNVLLATVAVTLVALGALLLANLWGQPPARRAIALVDAKFLDTAPNRQTYADLVAAKEDLSDFDCYACHEKNKPPPITFDANHKIILPKEHSNITMGHGSHDRNNLCYNCHNEANLTTLQVRDGRELQFSESVALCGSCHGPTYRDWDAGAHGRTSGHWDRAKGPIQRLACANCHDPHAPSIPSRQPAPGPNLPRNTPPHAAGKPPTSH